MQIRFIIAGNHADRDGNPVPKLKMTGRQHWTDKAKAYVAWKEYVQHIFGIELANHLLNQASDRNVIIHGSGMVRKAYPKPIDLQPHQSARMDLKIWWANEAHGDPENIFGSIADALFQNDKHLNGSFEAEHHPEGKGRVEVSINLQP